MPFFLSYYQRVLKIIQKINLLKREWVFFMSFIEDERLKKTGAENREPRLLISS